MDSLSFIWLLSGFLFLAFCNFTTIYLGFIFIFIYSYFPAPEDSGLSSLPKKSLAIIFKQHFIFLFLEFL